MPLKEGFRRTIEEFEDYQRKHGTKSALEYFGSIQEEDYVPDFLEVEKTHYQIYETVSEGTPISPVFASLQEMEEWLVNDGGRDGKVSRGAAKSFCVDGWVPSMMMMIGGEMHMGINSVSIPKE